MADAPDLGSGGQPGGFKSLLAHQVVAAHHRMEKGNRGTMKTSVDAVSGVERKITVEIPAEEVDRRIEREFAELRRSVPLRGFRKGKAPMEMVKRGFRTSVGHG